MLGMAGALPEYQNPRPPQHGQQRQQPGHMAMDPNRSAQQSSQYAGQASSVDPNYPPPIPMQYQSPYQPMAAPSYAQTPHSQHSHQTGPGISQGGFAGGPFYPSAQPQAFSYYPGQYPSPGQSQHGPTGRQGVYNTPYGRAAGQAYGQGELACACAFRGCCGDSCSRKTFYRYTNVIWLWICNTPGKNRWWTL